MLSTAKKYHKTSALQITKVNSVALVCKRTMPTERPPLVGEVVPTFADSGCAWSAQRIQLNILLFLNVTAMNITVVHS
jgi:hypothetical protein